MNDASRPTVIGVTGGVGSGKSAVADILARHGFAVIDADAIARDLLRPGTRVFAQVVAEFGDHLLTPEGELDRGRLGEAVFSDPEARRRLDDLTHPAIIERIRSEMETHLSDRTDNSGLMVLDVPLLYEVGMDAWCDEVWVVWCDRPQRIERLMRRDGMSCTEAAERMAAQMPLSDKVRRADRVIDNTGTPGELEVQVNEILEELGVVGDNDEG